MADITNPQAVAFCNERVRLAANKFMDLYWWCKMVSEEWAAQSIGSLIPNNADVLIDGSATDGRSICTGADINTLAARVAEFTALLEATANAKLNQIAKVSTRIG